MTETSSAADVPRPAWNKGKITGPKPPLRPSHVWAIRAKLDLEKRTRDLAMFNLAIDSKLRGCDLVALQSMLGSYPSGSRHPTGADKKCRGASVACVNGRRTCRFDQARMHGARWWPLAPADG